MSYTCFLCSENTPKTFSSKNLFIHERTVRPNNKIIPHSRQVNFSNFIRYSLLQTFFYNAVKARLQFHRSEPRVKTLKMEPFSEGLFIILFYNEPTFQYSPAKRMYTCKFEGGQGNKNWNAQETPFCWKEHVYKDSNMRLRCGSIRFEFNVDVRDFVEDN
ncbi:hypothetical protein RhiirC2_791616 [Rhizophagus irregularis]|uniref:Uncharacterized protein n=1 Tax=Rhizophagus irregularis TaxID=588596 RepID=A0A2N1MIW9_9GLOM|nr:hypothetical protein RhiirC2_791616 [Rhizophagus irregularis]